MVARRQTGRRRGDRAVLLVLVGLVLLLAAILLLLAGFAALAPLYLELGFVLVIGGILLILLAFYTLWRRGDRRRRRRPFR